MERFYLYKLLLYNLISQKTIDEIFSAIRVEEVVGDYVQLKKSGSNYKGLSPFSDEKTPSFMVSPSKQIWKDFSSGKGGNAVRFLMEYEQFSYPEALRYLAKKYNIAIEETETSDKAKEERTEKEALYALYDFTERYYTHYLLEEENGKAIGLTYYKERGISKDSIHEFSLGFSSNEWSSLYEHAKNNQYSDELLEKSGLFIFKEGKTPIDRFKGRLIFPIKSNTGRTIAFAGRVLQTSDKTAKYVNSPETLIYNKSKVLYALHLAKQTIAKEDKCYLVEGYTDVIALHQNGIKNVVASSGTALTTGQIAQVRRLTNNITLLYDGDTAGIKAAFRGVDLILEEGLNARICILPEGEDPDSFASKNNPENVLRYLEDNETDFIRFKSSYLLEESKNDPIAIADAIQQVLQSIALIGSPIKRELFIRETATIMNIPEETLFKELAKIMTKKAVHQKQQKLPKGAAPLAVSEKPEESIQEQNSIIIHERELVTLLLKYAWEEVLIKFLPSDSDKYVHFESTVFEEIRDELIKDNIEFTHPTLHEIYRKYELAFDQGEKLSVETLLKEESEEIQQFITDALTEKDTVHLGWEKKGMQLDMSLKTRSDLVRDAILRFKDRVIKDRIQSKINLIDNDSDEINEDLLYEIMSYNYLRSMLSIELNRVV